MRTVDHTTGFRRIVLALSLTAAAGLLPAEGAAQGRRELLLSDRAAPRGGCRVDRSPLPALGVLADSAALHDGLARLAAGTPVPAEVFALYSVRRGPAGAVQAVELLEGRLPEAMDNALRPLVFQHVRADARTARAFRLRIAPAAPVPVVAGHSETCEPEGGMEAYTISVPLGYSARKPALIRFKVMVGPQGEPLGVHPMGSSGFPELDDMVGQSLMRSRYRPGLVDGVPVEMEFIRTVRFLDR